ncbi:MAG: hypothetical protein KGD63_10790 [Candidatus Lokiarchaeota archaeon]|nr:hypothetical protein [Candidatus Lokiarchaeota archaeon]
MSDRLTEFRIENKKLKKQIEDLELKILSLVGNIELNTSGGPNSKGLINNEILELMNTTEEELNILSPKIDRFYTNEIRNLANKGIKILIITNERSTIPKNYRVFYDELKNFKGVDIINNPRVKFLLVFNDQNAIYSGGNLDKNELDNSILIETKISDSSKLNKIKEIFNLLLPSFMR